MFSLKRLHGCGIITNYDCSAKCAHCAYCSSPHWPKDSMSPEMARTLFRFLRQSGCASVHIGGGEPLLRPEKLYPILEAAQENGIGIDYVETNASWHNSAEHTGIILRNLHKHGVDTLLISMDPFHNEHIPFRKVKDLIRVCHANRMQVFPWKGEFFGELEEMGDQTTHSLEEWESRYGKGYKINLIKRYGLGMKGRDLETYKPSMAQIPLPDILKNATPCKELAGAAHFHLDLHGNFIPQSCPGLSIHFSDLAEGVNRSKYPLISRLYEEGIGALFSYASKQHGYVPNDCYVNKCDLCRDIRKFLVLDKALQLADAMPRGHYLFA